jgi:hypothetical protein
MAIYRVETMSLAGWEVHPSPEAEQKVFAVEALLACAPHRFSFPSPRTTRKAMSKCSPSLRRLRREDRDLAVRERPPDSVGRA